MVQKASLVMECKKERPEIGLICLVIENGRPSNGLLSFPFFSPPVMFLVFCPSLSCLLFFFFFIPSQLSTLSLSLSPSCHCVFFHVLSYLSVFTSFPFSFTSIFIFCFLLIGSLVQMIFVGVFCWVTLCLFVCFF